MSNEPVTPGEPAAELASPVGSVDAAAAVEHGAASAPRRRRSVRQRIGLGFFGVVVLALAIAAGAFAWALQSPPGTAWLLARLPFLSVVGPTGSLVGDFSAERVEIDLGSGRLRIERLAWRGLALARASAPNLWLRIGIDTLRADRVVWQAAARPSTGPAGPPEHLRVPVQLEIGALHIGELRFGDAATASLQDLDATLQLSAEGGSVHRLEKLALTWGRLQVKGDAQVATTAPFQLESHLAVLQAEAATSPPTASSATAPPAAASTPASGFVLPPWAGTARATGPLESPLVVATIRASASLARPAQALDARGTVRPFARWPLGDVELRADALDLSAFHAALPVTALTGRATATTRGLDQPGRIEADLANAAAGRWDQDRLPVRRIQLQVEARPNDLRAFELRSLVAQLGSSAREAGRVEGRGEWSATRWTLDARLIDVQTAALDGRAPALSLSGPLTLASSPATGAAAAPIDARGRLSGRLAPHGPLPSARVEFDARLGADRIEVRSAELHAGDTSATFAGTATREAGVRDTAARWHVVARTALVDFDPAAWAPGPEGSAWRNGVHRLNAEGRLDVVVPAAFASTAALDRVGEVRGDASLTIGPSLLAGVPLKGQASWRNADGRSAAAMLDLVAEANAVHLEGRMGLAAGPAGDAWDVKVDAPALARLAPWWRLAAAAAETRAGHATGARTAAGAGIAGAMKATAHVTGRWPLVSTQGELDAAGLQIGNAGARKAHARWTLGTAARAPVELAATLDGAALSGVVLESLSARLSGTAEAHHAELRAVSSALPPAWAEAVRAAGPMAMQTTTLADAHAAARSSALLLADGSILGNASQGLAGWRGTVRKLELVSTNGSAPATWVRASELGVEAMWGQAPAKLTLQPGRIDVLGAGLRWSRFAWQAATPQQPMRLDVEAEIDPIVVAPWLRGLQPSFGWGGDLTLGGHVSIRSSPQVGADVVIERRGGDLTVSDETGTQALGLTDLRFGLAAADGVWSFTQAIAGRTLGVAAGAIVARTSPGATWPTAATPIEGVLELDVSNLGTWGTWVPAGWRLGGALSVGASFGGRVGAPEYTGRIVGHGLGVRNFVQGVNIVDGDVAIALQGATARIERFSAHAGDGRLEVTGEAAFGSAPEAHLQLRADKFQVLGRVDRRIVASGAAQMRLDAKRIAVDGRLGVDEGLIDFSRGDAPTLGDDVQVIRRRGGPLPVPGSAEANAASQQQPAGAVAGPAAPGRTLALDLQVGMGEHLRIRGRGLDAGLRGDLRITSPGNRLAVNGAVYTVDGTYAAYGQKLAIDRGQLVFTGAVENPRLDIEATRPNLDIRVGVAVSGSALNPRVRLFSEPDTTEMDKLSWLVLGRASEGLGRTDTALLQQAALALLAGEGGGPGMSDRVVKSLGLDDLSVRQSDGEVKETIVSLGKQISRRWYVGYERGLNATAGSWQLIYRIAQRFTLRAQSGADNSVDVIWTWRWQ